MISLRETRANSHCYSSSQFSSPRTDSSSTVMSGYDFNDITVVDDDIDDLELMRSIVESKNQENAFYIGDIGFVAKKHRDWIRKMPRVLPYFAVKCHPDPTVIKILAALNGCFDCASQQELEQVLAEGVSADRIIFANPAKPGPHIRYAKKMGVEKMTVDSKEEIIKIKKIFPSAKLLIRIRNDGLIDEDAMTSLGEKFGCNVEVEAPLLMQLIKEEGMSLIGFSFHAGSPCPDTLAYSSGIRVCKRLIDYGRSIGMRDIEIIDIGGGFLGITDDQLEEIATAVNGALEDIDNSIKIISEPGRYYVEQAFTLAAMVHSKKEVTNGNIVKQNYYVNDGCYGSFIEELLSLKARLPVNLSKKAADSEEKFLSTIWGPTCDSHDCIIKDTMLPKFSMGDWMVWTSMGAYTISLACPFNGIVQPDVYPFIRKSDMKALKADIEKLHATPVTKIKNGF